ncbi:hypothetical protein Mp_1g20010 [Marchantia polymorpha subsp. ruderalis]|uniref:Uncharacterized protein n=2 Tax=Marchantia polymorpha TaxID=3197 RepID=A0AAF6AS42_MARPO|nr:hypothetical protein MARPO_0001s0338 [Marchantia polymorpha]BBM99262.1 hypothetical protein Mp_1g20010 [Marchantia polymorpha subsp. ruderalis]|eukprot:PTQ50344.1 hypothetical protein MARPO_0001s0338 [Marchantia polymorpha]
MVSRIAVHGIRLFYIPARRTMPSSSGSQICACDNLKPSKDQDYDPLSHKERQKSRPSLAEAVTRRRRTDGCIQWSPNLNVIKDKEMLLGKGCCICTNSDARERGSEGGRGRGRRRLVSHSLSRRQERQRWRWSGGRCHQRHRLPTRKKAREC